jgi:hypothetical protein
MAPEVFYTVCYQSGNPPDVIKGLHTFTPAILHGYCRHRVRFADYPGIIPEEGQSVRGMYVTGLTEANMAKLDMFEGDQYERVEANVKLLEKQGEKEIEGEEKKVVVYEFKDADYLERKEWDFEHFRNEKMQMWIREEC